MDIQGRSLPSVRPENSLSPSGPSSAAVAKQKAEAEISTLVTNLLSHYWTTQEDLSLRAAQIADWLDDLSSWPSFVVEKACAEWRKHNAKRPTPADICKICGDIHPLRPAKPREPPIWLKEAWHKGWWPVPEDEELVRPNWRDIPAPYLTKAEHALGVAHIAQKIRRIPTE